MRKLALVAASSVLFLVLPPSTASAVDMGSMGTISEENPNIKQDFPPIPGVYPQTGAQPFVLFRPYGCAAYNYCNRHTFDIDVDINFVNTLPEDIVSYGVRVTLSWDNPETNDVDLFVWPDDDPALGPPMGPCSAPGTVECNDLHPEIFDVIEPRPEENDPETEEDESKLPVTVYMSVVNDTGVNTGYTLELQWFLVPFGSFPDFEPAEREITQQREVTASRTPVPFDPGSDRGPREPLKTILIPGPDGDLVEQDLTAFASGHRTAPARTGTATWVWVTTAAISGFAVLSFAYFVWRRRRLEASL